MTHDQRVAIARVVRDIIKADNVIDLSELHYYSGIGRRYQIGDEHLSASTAIDFSKAVATLSELTPQETREIIDDMVRLSRVDGECSHEEALLVLALQLTLMPGNRLHGELMVSDVRDPVIDNTNVIYCETTYDSELNATIAEHLRYINLDFESVGLHFVYIPAVAKDFRRMDDESISRAVGLLAPTLTGARQGSLVETLRTLNTPAFCHSLLINKLGLSALYDAGPSLLIKVCVGSTGVTYLQVPLGSDVMADIGEFVDMYKVLTMGRTLALRRQGEGRQFVYHGFHRLIFDLLAFPGRKVESRVLIDTDRRSLTFIDIDNAKLQVPTKQLALYIFIVQRSICSTAHEVDVATDNERRSRSLDATFERIYGMLSDTDGTDFRNNLAANLSKLRKSLRSIDALDNVDRYLPERTADGSLRVRIDPAKVFVMERGAMVAMTESAEWMAL